MCKYLYLLKYILHNKIDNLKCKKKSTVYNCPHCDITIGIFGLLLGPVGTFSIFLITNNPSMTRPNTTCFPSKKLQLEQVIKNWHPLVSLPLFACYFKYRSLNVINY